MKKIMRMMVMAVAAVAMAAGFASCNKNDDGVVPSKDYYPAMTLNLKITEDALSIADFTVTYLDENGNEKSEAFNTTSFYKNIKFKSLPAKVKYSVTYAIKSTLPDKEKFDLSFSDSTQAGKTDGKDYYGAINMSTLTRHNKGVKKDKVVEFFNMYFKNWGNEGIIKE